MDRWSLAKGLVQVQIRTRLNFIISKYFDSVQSHVMVEWKSETFIVSKVIQNVFNKFYPSNI